MDLCCTIMLMKSRESNAVLLWCKKKLIKNSLFAIRSTSFLPYETNQVWAHNIHLLFASWPVHLVAFLIIEHISNTKVHRATGDSKSFKSFRHINNSGSMNRDVESRRWGKYVKQVKSKKLDVWYFLEAIRISTTYLTSNLLCFF